MYKLTKLGGDDRHAELMTWTDTPLNKAQTFSLSISFSKNDTIVSTEHWKGNHSPLRVAQSPRALVVWLLLPTLWESQQERLASVVTTFLDETEPMETQERWGTPVVQSHHTIRHDHYTCTPWCMGSSLSEATQLWNSCMWRQPTDHVDGSSQRQSEMDRPVSMEVREAGFESFHFLF